MRHPAKNRGFYGHLAISVLVLIPAGAPRADTINVGAGQSIQAAIAVANVGDTIEVAAGTFNEDLDFLGKAITVRGQGHTSMIVGTGTGPVVRFDNGEGTDSVLDSFTLTGGEANQGGGIFIQGSSPTIVRNVVFQNRAASRGSGIYVETSSAEIYNNLILYNETSAGDPHSVEVVSASPRIINNTVVRNDSNGIILRGSSAATVMNNILALNGSRGRGRGICDFSVGGVAQIQYNLFHRNRKSALLTDGRDFRKIRRAQALIPPPRLLDNADGKPNYVQRRNPPRRGSRRMMETSLAELVDGLHLSTERRRQRATDTGNPDPAYDDLDGSRNDMGFTGGPFARP